MSESLDTYLRKTEHETSPPQGKQSRREWIKEKSLTDKLSRAYLLSATYDGARASAVLKFYEPSAGRIYHWYDNTGHKPYCLTSLPPEELKKIPKLMDNEGLDHFERVEKIDPFENRANQVTKIVAHDPLSIGGKPTGSIRDIIPYARPDDPALKVWEADIKYYESFIYDQGIEMGMPYRLEGGKIFSLEDADKPSGRLAGQIEEIFAAETSEFRNYIRKWVHLLECPVPALKFVALDIEVDPSEEARIPDPTEAMQTVTCVSWVTSDGLKRVVLLRREGVEEGEGKLPEGTQIKYYDDEVELLSEVLDILASYPLVVTFNGDQFDLRYISHRAQRLGIQRDDIPIEMGREFTLLTYGIHLDLYRLFFNRSLQVYAFDQKYRENTLEAVASAILGRGKIKFDGSISQLPYTELAVYCLRDSELTYGLAAYDDHLTLKLTIVLARLAKMPVEDVIRQGVSNWIRSMMYAEHRQRNILIPTSKEILERKGETGTHAMIKGKKYRGAVVIEPTPGVNFNIIVLDFSSLYPSIIKHWNLSYETIRCPHEECRENRIPETSHWVCRKQQGITSLLIGSLKDLRVKWYKVKSKDETFPKETRSWYSIVQRTLKVLLNASYGVFGAEHFGLYCPPVAEATASIGRYDITSTIKKAQELGISVIYGDTDSVFLKSPSDKQIQQLIDWTKEALGMDLDVDKVYRYAVFSTRKKNYIGVYPNGNVDIKGLTGKKRNTPEFLKAAFNEMIGTLSEVKSENEFFEAKGRIKGIVKDCYTKLKRHEYSLEELAFTVVMSKAISSYDKTTPQHVKAVKVLPDEEQRRVGAGSVIQYVKTKREPGVKLAATASPDEIDVGKYVEHIQTTFKQVLDALDISFNEIIGISKLESFI